VLSRNSGQAGTSDQHMPFCHKLLLGDGIIRVGLPKARETITRSMMDQDISCAVTIDSDRVHRKRLSIGARRGRGGSKFAC
jgi:hypothetical protein